MSAIRTSTLRKPAKERKAEIVETTIRLAADIGPDRLTTDQLAEEIGISQAAIFRHFATKADIWEAVGKSICEMMGDHMRVVVQSSSQVVLLKKSVIAQLKFIGRTPAVPAILFSRELHAENETLRLIFVSLMERRHKKLSKIIECAILQGEFRAELNADDAAYLILSLIQGLAMRWSLNTRKFDLPSEGERLLSVLVKGFAKV